MLFPLTVLCIIFLFVAGSREAFQIESPATTPARDVENGSGTKWSRPSTQFNKKIVVTATDSHGGQLYSDDENDSCCACMNDGYLIWFSLFSYIAIATSLASIVSNLRFILAAKWAGVPFLTVKNCIIRLYASCFLGVLVCIELEWKYVMRRIRFLDYWTFRGFTYAFLGIITGKYLIQSLATAVTNCFIFIVVDELNDVKSNVADLTGSILTVVGVLYFLMVRIKLAKLSAAVGLLIVLCCCVM
jgi:hypothetical protein